MKKFHTRGLAFLLALAMVVGDFLPAVAAEPSEIVETETSEIMEETEQEVVEAEPLGTTATLPYTGYENDGRLFIYEGDFPKDFPFNPQNLIAILESKTSTFDGIFIEYEDKSNTSIPADVWNAAVRKLNTENEDRYVQFVFNEDDSYMMRWHFQKPQETVDSVTVEADISFKTSATVKFASTTFPAEYAVLYLDSDNTLSGYTAITTALGTETIELEYEDAAGNIVKSGARYQMSSSEGTAVYDSCRVKLGNIQTLSAGVEYTLTKHIYRGEEYTSSDGISFEINYNDLEGNGETFDAATLERLLKGKAGKTFNRVYIYAPATTTKTWLTKEVWNAVIPLLKTNLAENERAYLKVQVDDGNNYFNNFEFEGLQTATEDMKIGVTTIWSADGSGVKVSMPFTDFPADVASLQFYANSKRNDVETFTKAFGTEQKALEYVNISSGELLEGEQGSFWAGVNGDGNTTYSVNINNIKSFRVDEEYQVQPKTYRGEVFSWDSDGKTTTQLNINAWSAGKGNTGFTSDEMKTILAYYEGKTFDRVRIEQPNLATNIIYADVVTEAAKRLSANGHQVLELSFYDKSSQEREIWYLYKPTQMTSNQVVSATVLADTAAKKVYFTVGETANLKASIITFGYYLQGAQMEDFKTCLGTQWMELGVGDTFANGSYNPHENEVAIEISGLGGLNANTSYELGKKVYLGSEFENEGRTFLNIFWQNIERAAGSFTEQAVVDILTAREKQGKSYDSILIDYPSRTEATVSKAVWNKAVSLLKHNTTSDVSLYIAFDDYNSFALYWDFYNPQLTEEDINAEIELGFSTDGSGMLFNFADTDFPADHAMVGVYTYENRGDSYLFTGAFEGTWQDFSLGRNGVEQGVIGQYWIEENLNNNGYHVQMSVPRGLKSGVTYTMIPQHLVEETLEVGTSYPWTDYLTQDPDKGAKITWKSLNPDIAEVTSKGVLTPQNAGWFTISATYKTGGKTYTEMWNCNAQIVLKEISFVESRIEMEEPPAENENWLQLKTYPANAVLDWSELEWGSETTEGNLEISFDESNPGKYTVEGTGEAVITAVLPDRGISASCTIKVIEKTTIDPGFTAAMEDLIIVTNFDQTLADVKLPEDFTCAWKEPKTKLKDYVGMPEAEFAVLYTASNGNTVEIEITVPIVTITGIELWPDSPISYLKRGNDAVFGYHLNVTNGTEQNLAKLEQHEDYQSLIVKASGMVNANTLDAYKNLEQYKDGKYFVLQTTESTKPAKKTLKLSLVYGKKTIASDSYVIQVTKEEPFDFETLNFGVKDDDDDGNPCTGKFQVVITDPANYYKPTIKSTNTKILNLGKFTAPTRAEVLKKLDSGEIKADDSIVIEVPYTELKAGIAGIVITMADEIKSSSTYSHEVKDRTPKVLDTSFTINAKSEEKRVPITIQYTDLYKMDPDTETPVVVSNNSKFVFEETYTYDENTGRLNGYLTIAQNETVKKGTYTLELKIPVDLTRDGEAKLENNREQSVKVKVKVVDTLPKATVKQTENVNLFYDQTWDGESELPEGTGKLTLFYKSGTVTNVTMTDTDDFQLIAQADGTYALLARSAEGKRDTTATVYYDLNDEQYGTFTGLKAVLKISTANKAPALALSQTSDTLYPGYNVSTVRICEKATGKSLAMDELSWVKSKKEPPVDIALDGEVTALETGKNTYQVKAVYDSGHEIQFALQEGGRNATETFKLRVKKDNWTKAVDLTYKITAKWETPKLKLSSSKLTLNVHEDLHQDQVAASIISFIGYQDNPENLEVRFTGLDAKSKALLNNEMVLSCEGNTIFAKLNVNPAAEKKPSGTYKFKVWVRTNYFETSTNLTVNVVNKSVSQSVKLTKSGSIDVLRRDSSCITYKPKLSNLTGTMVGAWIGGPNAENFRIEWNNQGNIQVYAEEGAMLSTAVTYKVQFVLEMQNPDGSEYHILTPVQSFKVIQGKPKVVISSPEGNVLYVQAGGSLTANIAASLNKEALIAESVELADNDNELISEFNWENQTIRISNPLGGVEKFGKTWSLKLNITFTGQAINSKPTQVVYKIKVQ